NAVGFQDTPVDLECFARVEVEDFNEAFEAVERVFFADHARDGGAVEQFHDQVDCLVFADYVVKGDDIGVIEARDGERLVFEAPGILTLLGGDIKAAGFDGDVPLELWLPSLVNLAECALPEDRDGLEPARHVHIHALIFQGLSSKSTTVFRFPASVSAGNRRGGRELGAYVPLRFPLVNESR